MSWTGSRLPVPVGMVGKARTMPVSTTPNSYTWATAQMVRGRVGEVGSSQGTSVSGRTTASSTARGKSFDDVIRAAAQREGLDEHLVRAVVEAESGFNPQAVSPAGAKGLMQLMDETAESLGVKDPFDPVANVSGGVRFLRAMVDRFQSIPLALAAYNAGPGVVEKYGGVPPYGETRSYVSRILQLQRQYLLEASGSRERGGNGGHPIA